MKAQEDEKEIEELD